MIKDAVKQALYTTNFWRYRAGDILSEQYDGGLGDIEGYYRVEVDGCEPFWYPLHVGKRHRRDRIRGNHEPEVMEQLVDHSDGETVFWEVGAWRGYFSLALASRVASVVSFETRDHPVSKLREATDRNGFDNVQTVQDLVQSLDPYVEEYGVPDLVLLDIEGWEFEVLSDSPAFLDAQPTIVLEVHEESGWAEGEVVNPRGGTETVPQPDLNPDGVKRLLRESGYQLTDIRKRRDTNYHVLAVPEAGTDQPIGAEVKPARQGS